MPLHVSGPGSIRSGTASARLTTPVVASLDPVLRARAAQGAFRMLSGFVAGQAEKAQVSTRPLDALRFSRSALPLARDMRAMAAGVPSLQSALNQLVQEMEPLADATPAQVPRLTLRFNALSHTLREASLPAVSPGEPALKTQLQEMATELKQCRRPMAEDAAKGARALIACYDRLAGRPGMTKGVGTMLAEEARTLTQALARPSRRDGDDELGICFDARTSFSRVHAIFIALREQS